MTHLYDVTQVWRHTGEIWRHTGNRGSYSM